MSTKLHPKAVRFARRMRGEIHQHIIGRIVGVKQCTVSRAQTRVTWRDVR